jgi:hypothetical protein
MDMDASALTAIDTCTLEVKRDMFYGPEGTFDTLVVKQGSLHLTTHLVAGSSR